MGDLLLKYGSVCSGIEAATVAWSPIGFDAVWYSEIAKFPKAVLAYHYPTVPDLGDMTLIEDMIRDGKVEVPDILIGGCPCQSFSIAGLRRSLEDRRGNLSLHYVRVANAIDDVQSVRGQPGVITVWENVPGVLNTKDNAFGCLLGALAGEDVPLEPPGGKWTDAGYVFGPKRAAAWRCLDAQFFNLAQRRKRVFLVSGPRDWFRPQEVLFEWEGRCRDTPPSREPRERTSSTVEKSLGAGGITENLSKQTGDTYFKSVLPFDTTQITCPNNYSNPKDGDPCHPIASTAHPPAAVISIQDVRYPMDSGVVQGMAYGCDLSQKAEGVGFKEEISACVAPGTHPGHGNHVVTELVTFKPSHYTRDKDGAPSDVCPPLTKEADKGDQDPLVFAHTEKTFCVRRLMPEECEILQGLPPGYTRIPWKGKPARDCPDGPRYAAIGNSFPVPIIRWIGERINQVVLKERGGER